MVLGQDVAVDDARAKKLDKKCAKVTKPKSCEECAKIKKCVKHAGFFTQCASFGFTGKKCPPTECAKDPKNCRACVDMGSKVIKTCGLSMSLKCAELGWNRKTGKCVEKCFTKIPKSCKDCEEIGIDCINKAELKKVCKKFKFSPKKGCLDDGPKCPEKKPESCKDCEKNGLHLHQARWKGSRQVLQETGMGFQEGM